jgi:hypothetical protein
VKTIFEYKPIEPNEWLLMSRENDCSEYFNNKIFNNPIDKEELKKLLFNTEPFDDIDRYINFFKEKLKESYLLIMLSGVFKFYLHSQES